MNLLSESLRGASFGKWTELSRGWVGVQLVYSMHPGQTLSKQCISLKFSFFVYNIKILRNPKVPRLFDLMIWPNFIG